MVLGTVRKTLYMLIKISLDEGHPVEKCDQGVENWRFLRTLDTFIIATLVTGYEFDQAGLIAIAEIFTKIFFYYLHERVWGLLHRRHAESHYGSVGKAVSWRIVGTMDTIILSSIITGSMSMGGFHWWY